MKVIFLDIDGVITTPPTWTINFDNLQLIKDLVDITNAKIVLSSSWKNSCNNDIKLVKEKLKTYLKCFSDNDKLTNLFNWFINNIYDITPSNGACRGDEIQKYLDHHTNIDNYVIIDDDSDMNDEHVYHFVQTDSTFGITQRELTLCNYVLNDKPIWNALSLNSILKYEWRKKLENLPNKYDFLMQYKNLNEKNSNI